MQFKSDTKERFHAITLPGPSISASMTEELGDCLLPYLQNDVKNLVLKMGDIQSLDIAAAEKLVYIQQRFYENSASFVICEMPPRTPSSCLGILPVRSSRSASAGPSSNLPSTL